MKTIVISQPMFFPWVGLFEQIKLSDVFIHFNDVQLPQGRSFTNRVQIKTKDGTKWMTVPLKKSPSGIAINDAMISFDTDWRGEHYKFLEGNYAKAPYKKDVIQLVGTVYEKGFTHIANLDIFALELICEYFSLKQGRVFQLASDFDLTSRKSERLLEIIEKFAGRKYVTGWGALNYLDYNLFESKGVEVEYINYKKIPYNQAYGDFDPYVSILDLIAYEGKGGIEYIQSLSSPWKEFIQRSL